MKPIVADLHMHTIVSGHAFGTLREMAKAAAEKKLLLIGTTEHGPGINGTCDPIYFRNFTDAPRMLYGVEQLYGCEVNILAGGKLSLGERELRLLDYGIAGIHGLCYESQGVTANTDNVIRCMEHPKIKFISHPDENVHPLDYKALVEGAKATGTALEVNNASLRKPWLRPGCQENYRVMLPLCMEYGVPVIVNSDAHDPDQVGELSLALALLEEIGFDEDLILNNDVEKVKKFLLGE